MSWEIVVGIITLVGFIISVASIAVKLASIVAKLQASIDSLNQTLETMQNDNKEIRQTIREDLDDHESRITILETKQSFGGTGALHFGG